MNRLYKVFSENWKKAKSFKRLDEAEAYKYSKYGHAGYLIEYLDGEEVASHS